MRLTKRAPENIGIGIVGADSSRVSPRLKRMNGQSSLNPLSQSSILGELRGIEMMFNLSEQERDSAVKTLKDNKIVKVISVGSYDESPKAVLFLTRIGMIRFRGFVIRKDGENRVDTSERIFEAQGLSMNDESTCLELIIKAAASRPTPDIPDLQKVFSQPCFNRL